MIPALLLLFVLSLVVVVSIMTLFWIWGTLENNGAYADVGWAASFFSIAVLLFGFSSGYPARTTLFSLMIALWSLRLFFYLLRRTWKKREDERYLQLRLKWEATGAVDFKFYILFLFQALLIITLSLPFFVVTINPWPHISYLEWSGFALFLLALAGEALADHQLKKFKETAPPEAICEQGLWGWSRHPNYFFEWLVWGAYTLFALASPLGWTMVISWGIMTVLLIKFTGVALAEKASLKKRGAAYQDYQARVSAFFPWPPNRKT
jgi:Predicted membrane protein